MNQRQSVSILYRHVARGTMRPEVAGALMDSEDKVIKTYNKVSVNTLLLTMSTISASVIATIGAYGFAAGNWESVSVCSILFGLMAFKVWDNYRELIHSRISLESLPIFEALAVIEPPVESVKPEDIN